MTHTHIIKDVLPGSIAEELEISAGDKLLRSMIRRSKMFLIIIFCK